MGHVDPWRYLDPNSFQLSAAARRSCPACQCCTWELCIGARQRGSTCAAEAEGGSVDPTGCPCTADE